MLSSEEDRDLYRAPLMPWLFPTKGAAANGWKASEHVSDIEARRVEEKGMLDYSEARVRVATVHARQDLAGLYALQVALHKQLVNISRGVWLVGLLIWIAILSTSGGDG